MSSLARIIEKTISIVDLAPTDTEATEQVDLNGSDKFSVQVKSVSGAFDASLQVSNNGTVWTEIATHSFTNGSNYLFNNLDGASRYVRVELTNTDAVDISANSLFLVIGDAV